MFQPFRPSTGQTSSNIESGFPKTAEKAETCNRISVINTPMIYEFVYSQINFTLVQVTKAQMGNRGLALLFL